MSDRVVLNGAFRLVVTDSLRRLLNKRVQRQFPEPSQREKRAEVLEVLIAHPYLVDDPWLAAEERDHITRGKQCLKMLEGLTTRLKRGEIHYAGIEEATGKPQLSADQLKGHSLRLLDLAANWLLLAVNRHPEGGSGLVRRQYWLHDRSHRVLHLLHAETVQSVKNPEQMVKSGDGPWQDVDDSLERGFVEMIGLHLGPESIEVVMRSSTPAERLAHPNPEVLGECGAICKIDCVAEEKRHREDQEATYFKKYGPRRTQPSLLPAISASGIEIIYSD